MIISYRHGFTFAHSPKSAGSSIKVWIAPKLGPRDILLGARDERSTAGAAPNLRARWDAAATLTPKGVLAAIGVLPQRKVIRRQDRVYRPHFGRAVDHPSAAQLRAFDPQAWERHFKFSFTRNPFERTVSLYLYMTGRYTPNKTALNWFLQHVIEGQGRYARWTRLLSHWDIYALDDRIALDFIGRHETFDRDMAVVCGEIGIPWRNPGRAKVSKPYDFRDYYDERTRKLVARICEREIDHFGYRFDQAAAA